jgi:competence protein ComEA
MTADKLNRFWLLATFLLILIIILSAVIIRLRYDKGSPIEISTPQISSIAGKVYIEGAVNSPGLYTLKDGDSLETLIRDSGGADATADLSALRIYVPRSGESSQSQLIDLNRADLWLLQSLPGIGEIRAQAIIDYRREKGPFRDIRELTGVPGIGGSTFENIKNLVTVAP